MINPEVLKKRAVLNNENKTRKINSILDEIFYNAEIDGNEFSVDIPYNSEGFSSMSSDSLVYGLIAFTTKSLEYVIDKYLEELNQLNGVRVKEVFKEDGFYSIHFSLI